MEVHSLSVTESADPEAGSDFFKDLSNSFRFDLEDHGNFTMCLGGTPAQRLWWGESPWAWAPRGGSLLASSAAQYRGTPWPRVPLPGQWLTSCDCTHISAGKYDYNCLVFHVQALFWLFASLPSLIGEGVAAVEWKSQCPGQLHLVFLAKLLSLRCGYYDCFIIQV